MISTEVSRLTPLYNEISNTKHLIWNERSRDSLRKWEKCAENTPFINQNHINYPVLHTEVWCQCKLYNVIAHHDDNTEN